MPHFKTTYNLLTKPWEDELFDPNWMDSDHLVLPPTKNWDYQREMKVEDVDIWEVLYQASGGIGVYAAWTPYAEFYMISKGWNNNGGFNIETHYGAGSNKEVLKRCKQLNIPLTVNKVWVDPEDMWLYEGKTLNKKTFI